MNAIGRTPLIKLERLSQPGWAEIYVKYEGRVKVKYTIRF
jgi:cysteine synthase